MGIVQGANAQLTAVVAAPAVQIPFFICVEGMIFANKNVDCILHIKRFNLESSLNTVASLAHAPNFGVVV